MLTKHLVVGVLLSGCLLTQALAHAQQTIFNVPSGDVTPKGSLFLQHESQFRPWEPDAFWAGTHYAAYGIGHHTELDATLINLSAPSSHNIAVMPGLKSAIPIFTQDLPQRELKWTVGGTLPVSLEGKGVGSWGYTHLSGRLPRVNTRLTAGVSAGSEILFGRDTVCFMGGVEQPLTPRINLIGDWYSGTHSLGFLIPGLSLTIAKNTNAYVGFQIPNSAASGKSGLVFELSTLF